jgi:hypothetical protein
MSQDLWQRRSCLYAAEHPVRELHVGGAGKLLEIFERMAPNLSDRVLSRIGYRGQMTDQPKADEEHSLYEHLEGYDHVQGSFSEEAKPVSIYTGIEKSPALRWRLLAVFAAVGLTLVARRRPSGRIMDRVSQLVQGKRMRDFLK